MNKIALLFCLAICFSCQAPQEEPVNQTTNEVSEEESSTAAKDERALKAVVSRDNFSNSDFKEILPNNYQILEANKGRYLTLGDFNSDLVQDIAAFVEDVKTGDRRLIIVHRTEEGKAKESFQSKPIDKKYSQKDNLSRVRTRGVGDLNYFYKKDGRNLDLTFSFKDGKYALTRSVLNIMKNDKYPEGRILARKHTEGTLIDMAKTGDRSNLEEKKLDWEEVFLSTLDTKMMDRLVSE